MKNMTKRSVLHIVPKFRVRGISGHKWMSIDLEITKIPSLTVLISLSLRAVLADSTTTTNLILVFVT